MVIRSRSCYSRVSLGQFWCGVGYSTLQAIHTALVVKVRRQFWKTLESLAVGRRQHVWEGDSNQSERLYTSLTAKFDWQLLNVNIALENYATVLTPIVSFFVWISTRVLHVLIFSLRISRHARKCILMPFVFSETIIITYLTINSLEVSIFAWNGIMSLKPICGISASHPVNCKQAFSAKCLQTVQ